MSDEGTQSRELLSMLRERPVSVDTERARLRKESVLPLVRDIVRENALKQQKPKRNRAWIAGGTVAGLAAAAAVAFIIIDPTETADSASVANGPSRIELESGQIVHQTTPREQRQIAAGESLKMPVNGELHTTSEGFARLRTSGGLAFEVSGESRVSLSEMVPEAEQRRVTLYQGQLRCKVPPLGSGKSFAVATPNTQVVVHGTEFTVEVDSPREGVSATCVRVHEGLVAVHHVGGVSWLNAGNHWGCDEPAPEAASNAPSPPEATAAPLPPARKPAARMPTANPRGTLAKETRLLQSALAAERKGRRAQAARQLQQLLKRYPSSPLAPEARQALRRVSGPAPSAQ